MNKKMIVFLVLPLVLGACASQLHRGVVAMKVDESTAHVGLNKNEVSVGDHVELYANNCTGSAKTVQKCTKISKGHGTVTEVLSEDYAAVKFDQGVVFKEGDVIEKHSH